MLAVAGGEEGATTEDMTGGKSGRGGGAWQKEEEKGGIWKTQMFRAPRQLKVKRNLNTTIIRTTVCLMCAVYMHFPRLSFPLSHAKGRRRRKRIASGARVSLVLCRCSRRNVVVCFVRCLEHSKTLFAPTPSSLPTVVRVPWEGVQSSTWCCYRESEWKMPCACLHNTYCLCMCVQMCTEGRNLATLLHILLVPKLKS